MRIFKPLLISLLLANTLVPWNVTAYDFGGLAKSFNSNITFSNRGNTNPTERLLVQSLLEITQGRLQQASKTIDQLLQITPNFRLAQLVRGDLLMASAQQFQAFGSAPASPSETIADFREEARKRIDHYLSQQKPNNLPEPLWQLDSSQQYAIVVDADNSRLYLYQNENGKPKYVADYYTTIGKNGSEKKAEGDKRTPLGVYFSGPKLTQKLADIYGDAAYPLSYPNEWDRRQGKNGHGIWLHGTPQSTYSRPPNASDGCVVISNPDLKSLATVLQNGNVPIIIAHKLQWIDATQTSSQKEALSNTLESWRKDWQSQNTDMYLGYYSSQFSSQNMDFAHWSSEKRRVQANKPKVDIQLSNISMFNYPNSPTPMTVVTFDQSFKNATSGSKIRKRQYWILENQRWKIIYEGTA